MTVVGMENIPVSVGHEGIAESSGAVSIGPILDGPMILFGNGETGATISSASLTWDYMMTCGFYREIVSLDVVLTISEIPHHCPVPASASTWGAVKSIFR